MFAKKTPSNQILSQIDLLDQVDDFAPLNSLLVSLDDKEKEELDKLVIK